MLQTQLADLSRQVVVLTREVAIRDDPSLADEEFVAPNDMDEDGMFAEIIKGKRN